MGEVCTDKRFEIIKSAKKRLLEATNIHTRPDELAVLDSLLFRMWQMGWLPGCEKHDSAAAIRRPLQKPLTLEEACESNEPCVYFEDRDFGEISAASVDIDFVHGDIRYRSIDVLGGYINKEESAYGKTWRCWATKPTQEEREAAKWES